MFRTTQRAALAAAFGAVAILVGSAAAFAAAHVETVPTMQVPPPPVPTPEPAPEPAPDADGEVVHGEYVTDPAFVYEFDADVSEDSTADDVCQLMADVVKGKRHAVSEVIIMKKQPKVGDQVEINWNTPKVTITIKGKVKEIDPGTGLGKITVTEIKGEYKGVIAGLELNQDWAVLLDWP